jgi:hypothetical protein
VSGWNKERFEEGSIALGNEERWIGWNKEKFKRTVYSTRG